MDHVLGQPRALDQLQASLASGRMHHAWIFHGPKGVGKFTAAVALAKLLLCHEPQTSLTGQVMACDSCASCKLMRQSGLTDEGVSTSAHPDFHLITKELARFSDDAQVRARKLLNIPQDVVREHLIDPVSRVAQLRHGKVFIVDEAELLDERSQNLILKTLEEPPAGTTIILVTSSEDRLLVTIRSRCQRVAFGPLPEDVVATWVQKHLPEVAGNDRDWLIQFSGGSLGRVVLARDYDLFNWSRQVLPGVDMAATGQAPGTLGSTMTQLIDDLAKTWVDQHANASKEAANRMGAGLMLAMIAQHARGKLAMLAGKVKAGDVEAGDALLEPWLHIIESLGQAELALRSNVNMGLAMDHLVSMMARPGALHHSGA